MSKGITVASLLLSLFVFSLPSSYSQSPRSRMNELKLLGEQARQREQAFHERVRLLQQRIERGWTAEQVSRIMGLPERRTTRIEGSDTVEVWGYEGYDIRIEFRNGLVEEWFFRFM